MVYRYKKDTICFKIVSFFDLLPLASVNKVSVFNDFEYFFINTHLTISRTFGKLYQSGYFLLCNNLLEANKIIERMGTYELPNKKDFV